MPGEMVVPRSPEAYGEGGLIPVLKVFMPLESIKKAQEVLQGGWVAEGPMVKSFSKELSKYTSNSQVLPLNSCTSALYLALYLCDIPDGGEVISTPLTCVATNLAPALQRARIVWADIDPKTGNISPESIAEKITDNTYAIQIVHWGGNPCDIDEIHKIASEYNIWVIEDAAHALGAKYNGKYIGTHSDFVCFSFQAVKQINTGDGGAVAIKSQLVYDRATLLKWFGIDRGARKSETFWDYDIPEPGFKFQMNDIAASIGLGQLPYLKENITIQRRNAHIYNEMLEGVDGIRLLEETPGAESSCWLYTLLVDDRDMFVKKLKKHHIATSIVHTRNDMYSCFKEFRSKEPLPNLDYFVDRQICLPNGWWVTEDMAYNIANIIRGGW